jgi:CheY-like chemotaxis protein
MNKKSVLIVDDSPVNHISAEEQLELDYDLHLVGNYVEAERTIREGKGLFDAVLSDLLMPSEAQGMVPAVEAATKGQEMPIGIFLALTAVKYGVPLVAVVSNLNHHFHPAAWALDWLLKDPSDNGPQIFRMGASRLQFISAEMCPTKIECSHCGGTGKRQQPIEDMPESDWATSNLEERVMMLRAFDTQRKVACGRCFGGKLSGKNWRAALEQLLLV